MIKGITVTLYERTQSGVDSLNNPVYTEVPVQVDNVLVTPTNTDEMTSNTSLEGRKIEYELCLPKGDNHSWENCKVSFWGECFIVIGIGREYIEENIPLSWNRKIKVARYE